MAALQGIAAIRAQKQALRKTTTASLHRISSMELDQQSQAIASRLFSLPAFQACTAISCYLNMPTAEARTPSIVDSILNSGKNLFVPKIYPGESKMDFLRIYSAADLASLASGTWGIKEPGDNWEAGRRARVLDEKEERLEMIVLPGVAFDRALHRLGHGKGYYDRFITSYVASGRTKPLLVAVCLREQLLPKDEFVPHHDHDWNVDVLITPDETIAYQEGS